MKVIVTGSTGFIGRNLAERLHEDGFDLLATGRSPAVGAALRKRGIEFQEADLLDADRLQRIFTPADAVIHCAAKTGDWGRPLDFYRSNVLGTRNVTAACRTSGIAKLIFVSTPSVYFSGKNRSGIRESDPLPEKQRTHYSRTKLAAEREVQAFGRQGRQVMIFRPRAVFGPYDRTFVPRILRMAAQGKLTLINNGTALTDITCIDNFTAAVRSALSAHRDAWGEVYNVANGEPIRVRDWFARVLEIFSIPFHPKNIPLPLARVLAGAAELAAALRIGPSKPLLTRFSVGYLSTSMTMSIEKAKSRLGYRPDMGTSEGFSRYAGWYRDTMDA